MNSRLAGAGRQAGLSYIEVLIAVVIIAMSVIPATDALRNAMKVAESDSQATINHYRLISKMEEVLADPFSTVSARVAGISTATSYSDTAGSTDRRLVFISRYDGDNADADDDPFTGTEADLLWVRVEIEGTATALQALKAE